MMPDFEYVTAFDLIIFLGALTAMLLSSMPKKAVMALVVMVSIWGVGINMIFVPDESIHLAGVIECVYALAIICFARFQRKRETRIFFWIMAGFLLLSTTVSQVFIPLNDLGFMSQSQYVVTIRTVTLAHILSMLTFSDGIQNLVRSVGNSPSTVGRNLFGNRS